MKTAVIGNLKKFFERLKRENPTIQLSIPILGLGVNIPISEVGKLQAVRKNSDSDNIETPFVESKLELLIDFYAQYKYSKEYKFSSAPYAETVPLQKDGKGFSYGVDVNEYKINALDVKYRPPNSLKRHSYEAITIFKKMNKLKWNEIKEEWENNNCLRISEWDTTKNIITIQPATYFDQVGTNLTLDWASGLLNDNPKATIRNDIEGHENGALSPLKTSTLANTLGVAVVVVNTQTQEVLIPIRGANSAIMHHGMGKFHCSASGSFSFDTFPSKSENLTFDIFMKGMEQEIKEELGLESSHYTLTPLAFSRELVRGGKPQLFFIAETNIEIKSLKAMMKDALFSWEFLSEESLPIDSPLFKYLESPLDAPQEMFTYEGWMALKIALAYLYKEEPPFPIC